MGRFRFFCWLILSIFIVSLPALAQLENTKPSNLNIQSKKIVPESVISGVYPISLWDFDLRKKTFNISFYSWWRTKDANYHPEKSIGITNATNSSSKLGNSGQNGDEYFTDLHYYATIEKEWDLKFFPFDHQTLEVHLEDFLDINHIVFEPDFSQSHIHKGLILAGWTINGLSLKSSTTHYDSNFGNISKADSTHARLSFIIDIKRNGWQPLFNYFIGFLIAFFLSMMVFFVDCSNLNARASLSLGAIFTAVGNKYILDNSLPVTTEFTLSDGVQFATFMVILTTVFALVFVNWKLHQKSEKIALWYNTRFCVFTSIIYFFFVGTWIMFAVLS